MHVALGLMLNVVPPQLNDFQDMLLSILSTVLVKYLFARIASGFPMSPDGP